MKFGGIFICYIHGKCGKRMRVGYQKNSSKLVPVYRCNRDRIQNGGKVCQTIMGEKIDQEISGLLLKMLNPLAIKVAIEVQNELNERKLETCKFYAQQVERAGYEAELAKKRYMAVDPQNRLVATELEAAWNQKLRQLEEARCQFRKKKEKDVEQTKQTDKEDIIRVASDFPKIWSSPTASFKEKKRLIRLLIEDVTAKNDDTGRKVILNIRFKAATSKTLVVDKKLHIYKIRKTSDKIIKKVDELTEDHIPSEIAAILNSQGYRLWNGGMYSQKSVKYIIRAYGLKRRYQRLREKGYITLREKMAELGVTRMEIMQMRKEGKVVFFRATEKKEYLYERKDSGKYLTKTQP